MISSKRSQQNQYMQHGFTNEKQFSADPSWVECLLCREKLEYFFLTPGKTVSRYSLSGGEKLPKYEIPYSFNKFLWMGDVCCFIGWKFHDKKIYLFNENFNLLTTTIHMEPLSNVIMDDITNNIFALGERFICKYSVTDGKKLKKEKESEFRAETESFCRMELSTFAPHPNGYQRFLISFHLHGFFYDINEGCVVSKKSNIHSSNITAVLFHSSLKWFVTGDELGVVQGWNTDWILQFKMNDHKGPIRFLLPHPEEPGIISIAADCQILIWNAILREKEQEIKLKAPVNYQVMYPEDNILMTGGSNIHIWKWHCVYYFFSALSASASILYTTNYSRRCWNVVVASRDSVVRILDPRNGKQHSVLVDSCGKEIFYMAYSNYLGKLYSIMDRKRKVIISSCEEGQMKHFATWDMSNDSSSIRCVTVFESAEIFKLHLKTKTLQNIRYTDKVFIFLGYEDGSMAALHPTTGDQLWTEKVHASAVNYLQTYSRKGILMSCDSRTVNVWKVSVYHRGQPVLLLTTFCLEYPITHVGIMGNTICMAVIKQRGLNYGVIMNNYDTKVHLTHSPVYDHKDRILCLAVNNVKKICATSSLDGTLQIRNRNNILLKIFYLNIAPKLITFASHHGDIIVNIGKHLFKIFHDSYLSPGNKPPNCSHAEEAKKMIKMQQMNSTQGKERDILHPKLSLEFFDISGKSKFADAYASLKLRHYEIRDQEILDIANGKVKHTQLPENKRKAKVLQQSKLTQKKSCFSSDMLAFREKRMIHIRKLQEYFAKQPGSERFASGIFIPNSTIQVNVSEEDIEGISTSVNDESKSEEEKEEEEEEEEDKEKEEESAEDTKQHQGTTGKRPYLLTAKNRRLPPRVTGFLENSLQKNVIKEGKREVEKSVTDTQQTIKEISGDPSIKSNAHVVQRNGDGGRESESVIKIPTIKEPQKGKCEEHQEKKLGQEEGIKTEREKREMRREREEREWREKKLKEWKKGMETKMHEKGTEEREGEKNSLVKKLKDTLTEEKNEAKSFSDMAAEEVAEFITSGAFRSGDLEDLIKGLKREESTALLQQTLRNLRSEMVTDVKHTHKIINILSRRALERDKEAHLALMLLKSEDEKYTKWMENSLVSESSKIWDDVPAVQSLIILVESLRLQGLSVISAVLVIYIKSKMKMRSTILCTLLKLGLVDPDAVLEEFLLEWKTDLEKKCSYLSEFHFQKACNMVKNWLQHWMNTLECHLSSAVQMAKNVQCRKRIDQFLLDELQRINERQSLLKMHTLENCPIMQGMTTLNTITANPVSNKFDKVILPIEALNYFCKVHAKQKNMTTQNLQSCSSDLQILSNRKLGIGKTADNPWEISLHKPTESLDFGNI